MPPAPARPLTAYQLYIRVNKERLAAAAGGVLAAAAAEWKGLSDAEKQRYSDLARQQHQQQQQQQQQQ